jgi:hypothetical protein
MLFQNAAFFMNAKKPYQKAGKDYILTLKKGV